MRFKPEAIPAILEAKPQGPSPVWAFINQNLYLVDRFLPGSSLTLGKNTNMASLKIVRPVDEEQRRELAASFALMAMPVPERAEQRMNFEFYWRYHFATEVTNLAGRKESYIFPYGFANPLAQFFAQPQRPKRQQILEFLRLAQRTFHVEIERAFQRPETACPLPGTPVIEPLPAEVTTHPEPTTRAP